MERFLDKENLDCLAEEGDILRNDRCKYIKLL